MLKVHRYSSTLKPGVSTGTRKPVMPSPLPGVPLVRAKTRSWEAVWMPVFHVFSPLITQPAPSRMARVSMNVASLPWAGSVMPNAKWRRPRRQIIDPLVLLPRTPVVQHQEQADVVADDGVLVLQIAVQAEALAGQVLADHRHAQVGAVPAAVPGGRVPVVAGRVGPTPGPRPAAPPTRGWAARRDPVGPGVLPAVIEEPDVVVLLLERPDLAVDELVEFGQVVPQVLGQGEVHVVSPLAIIQAGPGVRGWRR